MTDLSGLDLNSLGREVYWYLLKFAEATYLRFYAVNCSCLGRVNAPVLLAFSTQQASDNAADPTKVGIIFLACAALVTSVVLWLG